MNSGTEPLGDGARRTDPGVEDDEALHALGVLDGETQPDRPAPVLHDDRRPAEVELLREPLDRGVVEVVRVVLDPGGLVRASEAEVVGRDDPAHGGQRRDQLPAQERPARLAVEQQHRVARSSST